MILKVGNFAVETTTLPKQKRPSLLIAREPHLHSKVGMMMDDERAAEFMDYLSDMTSLPICPYCHQGVLRWMSDSSFDECGYSGSGLVQFYECPVCGAEIEVVKSDGTDSVDG